jgi:hypothetical protein
VIVTGANGVKKRVPTTYVKAQSAWVGRANFYTEDRPAKVGVEFSVEAEEVSFEVSGEEIDDALLKDIESFESLLTMTETEWTQFTGILASLMEEMGVTSTFEPNTDYSGEGAAYGTQTISGPGMGTSKTTKSPLPDDITEADLVAQGFEKLFESEYLKNVFYKEDGDATTYIYLDLRLKMVLEYIDEDSEEDEGLGLSALDVIEDYFERMKDDPLFKHLYDNEVKRRATKRMLDSVREALDNAIGGNATGIGIDFLMEKSTETQRAIARSHERLAEYQAMVTRMNAMENRTGACINLGARILRAEVYDERAYLKKLERHRNIEIAEAIFSLVTTAYFPARDTIKVAFWLFDSGKSIVELSLTSAVFLEEKGKIAAYLAAEAEVETCMRNCSCECVSKIKPCDNNCKCTTCKQEEEEPKNSEPCEGGIDPSGYVYEAVPSNRVAGVTATAYSKKTETDAASLWDAAQYGQTNPLLTDILGAYAWDVPEGFWQVKFEKAGYETAYSDWLPVPPPQLEVNVGIVSRAAPTVTGAYAYEDGVDISFSKYMKPALVSSAISIALGDDTVVSGSVVPVNLENELASLYRFVPDQPFADGTALKILVRKEAESYADVPMDADYVQALTVTLRPQGITADDIEITFGESGVLTATVTPHAAAAGKHITILSNTPSIAFTATEAVTNEHGQIKVAVTANLPGMAYFTLSVDGTEIQKLVAADIVLQGSEQEEEDEHEHGGGGDPNGGDPNGGDPNGGDPNGGDPNGGDPNGGDPNGGDPNGGDPNGGDPNGGDPNGGDPNGGDPNGGDPNGGDPNGGSNNTNNGANSNSTTGSGQAGNTTTSNTSNATQTASVTSSANSSSGSIKTEGGLATVQPVGGSTTDNSAGQSDGAQIKNDDVPRAEGVDGGLGGSDSGPNPWLVLGGIAILAAFILAAGLVLRWRTRQR